jgi:hypothetical protein
MELRSVITCPNCRQKEAQEMPTDSCVFFFECPSCKTLLRPRGEDCCVFCSYGSVKCPPIQAGECCAEQGGALENGDNHE